jgi:hypothetical protein
VKEINFKIFVLFRPKFLKAINSSPSPNFIKKNCVLIKKINGITSYKTEGTLNNVKNNGTKNLISVSLKKEISSNIVKTKARAKKIKKSLIVVAKKLLIIYFWYTLREIIYFLKFS